LQRHSAIVLVATALASARSGIAGSLLSPADEAFWQVEARHVVDSARLDPGQSSGKWRNGTAFVLHVPGGNMGYPAFWVRDAAMMLGEDLITAAELEGWIRLISSTIRTEDWPVRPGVLVPAYAVPDHINFDGKATYYPGNYETGIKQGGKPWGKFPPLDDHFYFLTMVHHLWKMTGSLALLRSRVKMASGEMNLAELCEKVYRVAPSDAETALVIAGEVETENAKDFGFCDAESKSGKLLFPSLLKYAAAYKLAELFAALGQKESAAFYRRDAALLKSSIPGTFFHASQQSQEGWLHSATGLGAQPDVWGSAFALWSGALKGDVAQRVAQAMVRAYREKTAVREGCVRQILTTDQTNRGGWQFSTSSVGEYQNGGYWGTPAGWYIAAMWRADRGAATNMARDYIQFLRTHKRDDGRPEAWEWFNPDIGRTANPLYVATVALPYLSLKQAGLLKR
jgi:hypothetical protein